MQLGGLVIDSTHHRVVPDLFQVEKQMYGHLKNLVPVANISIGHEPPDLDSCLGFRVWGLGFRSPDLDSCLGLRVEGLGFRV